MCDEWICAYYFICDQYAPTSYEGSDGTAGYAETVSVHEPSGNESQGTDLHREKGNQPVCDDPICYCRYSTVLYSGIVFGLRDYHLNDVKNYVINAGVLWIIYFILQWLNLKWLEDTIVKKIEKGADL